MMDDYRSLRHIPEEKIEQISKIFKEAVNAIDVDSFPKDGICSHLGINVKGVHPFNLGVCHHGGFLLLTIYCPDYYTVVWTEYSFHKLKARISEEFSLPVSSHWNGEQGNNGISIVLARDCPDSLMTGIKNYYKLKNVFKLSEEEKQQFRVWREWLKERISDDKESKTI